MFKELKNINFCPLWFGAYGEGSELSFSNPTPLAWHLLMNLVSYYFVVSIQQYFDCERRKNYLLFYHSCRFIDVCFLLSFVASIFLSCRAHLLVMFQAPIFTIVIFLLLAKLFLFIQCIQSAPAGFYCFKSEAKFGSSSFSYSIPPVAVILMRILAFFIEILLTCP